MKRRGITLLELLVVTAIIGFLTLALTRAFAFGITYQVRSESAREREDQRIRFEDKMRELLQHAYVTSLETDTSSYFIGGATDAGGGTSGDRLTFTALGGRLPQAIMDSTDDFEALNEKYGPRGGLVEISLGLEAVGSSNGESGLFVREQRPSDGDPDQGGYEQLLDKDVSEIEYEFFDGEAWITSWDTTDGTTERRLPAAIRITYRLQEEEDSRTMVVRLINSDVNPDSPLGQIETTGGATGTTGGTGQ